MGAGANAWAAAWGCSRERARWQEGTACVQNRHRQRAPLMFFVSLFCNQGMNHALPGAHSLLPPRASQPCLPWGSRAPQNGGVAASGCERSLCHLGSGSWAIRVGSGALAVCVAGSWGRLETPCERGLSGAAGVGSSAWWVLVFLAPGSGWVR